MLQGYHNEDKQFGPGADMDIGAGMPIIADCLGWISLSSQNYRAWCTTISPLGRQCSSEMMSRIDSIRRKLKGAPRTSIPNLALAIAYIDRPARYTLILQCATKVLLGRTLKFDTRLRRSQVVWLKSCYKKSRNFKRKLSINPRVPRSRYKFPRLLS